LRALSSASARLSAMAIVCDGLVAIDDFLHFRRG
jgi:hypothetical protein